MAANTIAPYCSVEAPVGDYVMLAEIDADGTIVDKRRYAKRQISRIPKQRRAHVGSGLDGDPISVNTSDPPFEKTNIFYTERIFHHGFNVPR